MHVLIVTNYYPPEIGAASYLYQELTGTLIEHGHRVTVVTGFPRYRMGQSRERGLVRKEQVEGCTVIRIASSPLDRGGPMRRGLDHVYLGPSLFLGGLLAARPDVVLAYSPPLTLGLAAWGLARLWRVPYVVNLQDLFPQYAIEAGLMTNHYMIRGFEALEQFIYRTADAVTVNSKKCREHVAVRGGSPERVHVVSNWIDVEFVRPGPRNNAFRQKCGLGDSFVVTYAGTMGYQQDLDTVVEAAALLTDEVNVRFHLVGDGVERPRLEQMVRDRGLRNVLFTSFQPRVLYPQVAQAGDLYVVALKKEVHIPSIPSKLLNIMAAGKPALVSADMHGDAPELVQEVGCGLAVPPGDPSGFAEAVRAIARDPEMALAMGRRGREYAERELGREVGVARLEEVIRQVITERQRAAVTAHRLVLK